MKLTNKGLWIVFTLRNTIVFHGKIPFYFIYYYFILRHLARQSARLQKRLLFPPQPRYVIFRQSRIGNLVSKYHILVFRFLRQWIKTLLPSFLPPKQFATKIKFSSISTYYNRNFKLPFGRPGQFWRTWP